MPERLETQLFYQILSKHINQKFSISESFLDQALFKFRTHQIAQHNPEFSNNTQVQKVYNLEQEKYDYLVPSGGDTWKSSYFTRGILYIYNLIYFINLFLR